MFTLLYNSIRKILLKVEKAKKKCNENETMESIVSQYKNKSWNFSSESSFF